MVDAPTYPVDRVGKFRGVVTDYRPVSGRKGSVGIELSILITAIWDSDTSAWDDSWEQYRQVAHGTVCVVKNDQTVNETGARGLMEGPGWDGRMVSIVERSWVPTPTAFTVEVDDLNRDSFKIGFLNSYEYTPGGSEMTLENARVIDSRYGGTIRAIAGNVVRNAPSSVPATKPKAPPSPSPKTSAASRPAPPPAAEPPVEPEPTDDIPF